MNDGPMTLATLAKEIEYLAQRHEENREEIEKLKERLTAYDLLAAKWGGVCMLAVGIGTVVMTFSDKIKALLAVKP